MLEDDVLEAQGQFWIFTVQVGLEISSITCFVFWYAWRANMNFLFNKFELICLEIAGGVPFGLTGTRGLVDVRSSSSP